MPDGPVPVDPQTLKDLLDAEQFCRLLGTAGQRIEFWEAYCLLKADPEMMRAEIARIAEQISSIRPAEASPSVLEKLRFIRSDMGPLVHHLRQLMAILPDAAESSRMDLTIVFVVASAQGREAAVRWVADPVTWRDEAALRVRVMAGLVNTYRRALLEAHIAASPRELPPAPEPSAREAEESAEAAPRGPDPMLGALRLVERCQEVLRETSVKPETWELLCLAVSDGPGLGAAVRELRRLKARGKPGEFAGAAYAFRQRLGQVREQHGLWVDRLRQYIGGLNLTGWDKDIEGIVLGLLVVSPQGRARVERWFQKPREYLRVSASYLGTLVTRAIRVINALRKGDEEGVPPDSGRETKVAFD
jgi:hypothetical protein